MKDRKLIYYIFIFFSVLYFSTGRLIVGINDGSQYAQTLAIGLEGRFSINSFLYFTKHVDYAFNKGNYYSDRTIGLSLLTAPLITISDFFSDKKIIKSKNKNISIREDKVLKSTAILLLSTLGSLLVVLVFFTLKELEVTNLNALIVSLSFGLCSLNWKYSSLFMSHVPAGFFLTLAIYLTIKKDILNNKLILFSLCFILGFLPLLRYELFISIPFIILYLILNNKFSSLSKSNITLCLIYFLVPILLLLIYNTICFDSPFSTYTKFYSPHLNYWSEGEDGRRGGGFTPGIMFGQPILRGLKILFFGLSDKKYSLGILVLQPVIILSFLGIFFNKIKDKSKLYLLHSVCLSGILISAKSWGIDGGGMKDPRYFFSYLPILFFYISFFLDFVKDKKVSTFIFCSFSVLSVLGFMSCLIHFTETDDLYKQWTFIKKDYKLDYLISYETADIILSRLFSNTENIKISLLSSVILSLVCLYSRKIRIFLNLKSSLIVINYIAVSVCCFFIFSLFYLNKNPINKFNRFDDTLSISDQVLDTAIQESSFTYLNKANPPFQKVTVNDNPCDNGILVIPRSIITLKSPNRRSYFRTKVGLSDLNIWTWRPGSKVVFAVLVNKNPVWISEPLGEKSELTEISLLVEPNSEISLLTSGLDSNTRDLTLAWCEPIFL